MNIKKIFYVSVRLISSLKISWKSIQRFLKNQVFNLKSHNSNKYEFKSKLCLAPGRGAQSFRSQICF